MIVLKTEKEIEQIRKAGKIIANLHNELKKMIKPGIDTWEIEEFSRNFIEKNGAKASQIGFEGYKYATTISINDEVAHAFPRKGLKLKNGDIITVDTVVEIDGGVADSAWTYPVGKVSKSTERLLKVAKESLYIGIRQAIIGNRMGDIGFAINDFVERQNGYGNVRDYIGHGIGPTMHEAPQVPHFGEKNRGIRLKDGMTITIEPMVNEGGYEVNTSVKDGWTVTTVDGSLSAQFEHTIAITNDGPKILTSQDEEIDKDFL